MIGEAVEMGKQEMDGIIPIQTTENDSTAEMLRLQRNSAIDKTPSVQEKRRLDMALSSLP